MIQPESIDLEHYSEEFIDSFSEDINFDLVLNTSEGLTPLQTARIGLLVIAATTFPTGLLLSSRYSNEVNALYSSVNQQEITIPEKYTPTNEVEQAAADAWVVAERSRLKKEAYEQTDLKEKQKLAVSLAVAGGVSNIASIVPVYFRKKKAPGNYDLIEE